MTTTDTTPQALAALAYAALETATRTNGEAFYKFRDGSPEWMQELAMAAHQDGQIWPDDTRYAMLREVLGILEEREADEWDEARDELEPEIYTANLTAWLASATWRVEYVDDAAQDYGTGPVAQMLALGYLAELQEVWDAVTAFLVDLADEMESEAEGSATGETAD